MKRRYWWGIGAALLAIVLVVTLRAFLRTSGPSNYVQNEADREALASGITLRDVTLEQPDGEGNLLWRMKSSEVTYSPDQKVANVTAPDGELYQDGELLYRVKADQGEIRNDGNLILLQGNIVATGVKNDAVLRGNQLEWYAQEDAMILRGRITGTHPQLRVAAQEAYIYDREKRMELVGDVVASTVVEAPESNPYFKLQTQTLQWFWQAERVESNRPLRVERFQNETITAFMTGDRGVIELATERATLTNNVNVQMVDENMDITGDRAIWVAQEEDILMDQSIRIENTADQLTLTAQQGRLDLLENMIYLTQEVLALSQANSGRLSAERLNWNLETDVWVAEGSVDYQQQNPQLRVRGPRAEGRIEAQTIVVSGGQVVTEIVPNN